MAAGSTAALCAVLAIGALIRWSGADAAWLLAGGLLYQAGAVGVTMGCNVPHNNALAAAAAAFTLAPA